MGSDEACSDIFSSSDQVWLVACDSCVTIQESAELLLMLMIFYPKL
jgi:hypothetical protein